MGKRPRTSSTDIATLVQLPEGVVAEATSSALPPLGDLARHFGVSRPTLTKAAALLRERGVLTFGRGSPLRLVTSHSSSSPVARSS